MGGLHAGEASCTIGGEKGKVLDASFEKAEGLFGSGAFADCATFCRAGLAGQPDAVGYWHLLGVAAIRMKDADGLGVLRRALSLAPADLRLRFDLARALEEGGDLARSIEILAQGAPFHPGDAELAARMGRLLSDHGRHEDAQSVLRAALAARPFDLSLRGLLAAELAADRKTVEALAHLRLLAAFFPDQALFQVNLGVLSQSLGQDAQAERHYGRALAIDSENALAHVNLATLLLSRGEDRDGWRHYEYRRRLPDMRAPPAGLPDWRGEPGKVLLTAEQGFGDILQFARFLPVAARHAQLWLDVPDELRRLFKDHPNLEAVIGPGDPVPSVDFTLPLLSLPFALGLAGPEHAPPAPYLSAAPATLSGSGGKIGLIWHGRQPGGELFVRRMLGRRSCPLAALAPLWRKGDHHWYSLQIGAGRDQLSVAGGRIEDLAPRIGDFADSAGFMMAMDLIISIDTAGAHLAGALGRPLWLLLSEGEVDYRWKGSDGRSRWYPKAQIFRAGPEGWAVLAAALSVALKTQFPT